MTPAFGTKLGPSFARWSTLVPCLTSELRLLSLDADERDPTRPAFLNNRARSWADGSIGSPLRRLKEKLGP